MIIVDLNNIYARMYHALKNDIDKSAYFAVYGTLNQLFKFQARYTGPMVLCVDSQASIRKAKYPLYKANRESKPDDYFPQLDKLITILEYAGVVVNVEEGYEADDLIYSTYRQKSGNHYFTVITNDKDMLYLTNDATVTVVTGSSNKDVYRAMDVQYKYRVEPRLIWLYFALVGDTIDNIPGVHRVGPVRASHILGKGRIRVLSDLLSKDMYEEADMYIYDLIVFDKDNLEMSYNLIRPYYIETPIVASEMNQTKIMDAVRTLI